MQFRICSCQIYAIITHDERGCVASIHKPSQAGDEGLTGEVSNNINVYCLFRQTHKNADVSFYYRLLPDAANLEM